jgi:hypothetical protein
LGGVNDALDFDALCDGLVENQVLFEVLNSPHPQLGKLLEFVWCTQVRLSCQFGKGSAGRKAETASYGQVAIFTDVSKVANEITAGGGPYDSSAHASLSLLPGLDERGHRVERRGTQRG